MTTSAEVPTSFAPPHRVDFAWRRDDLGARPLNRDAGFATLRSPGAATAQRTDEEPK